ncbi:hypothetical protein M0Q28_05535 [Patescibacteria group bacterium]|nr:hypothetical protein [Patescibacteria group bacterium]
MSFPNVRVIAIKAVKGWTPLIDATTGGIDRVAAADYVVAYKVGNSGCMEIRFLKCRWPLDNISDGEWCEILDAIKKREKDERHG